MSPDDENDLEEEMPEADEALTREQRMVMHKNVHEFKIKDLKWNAWIVVWVWSARIVLLVVFMFGAYKIAELFAPR